MGRRNLDRYSPDDWPAAAPTVQAAIDTRWRVVTECEVCELRIVADLKRIACAKGPTYRLWGQRARCRRMGCRASRLPRPAAGRWRHHRHNLSL